MAKTQGICPGQRIIRDSELVFGAKKFRTQGISSGQQGIRESEIRDSGVRLFYKLWGSSSIKGAGDACGKTSN